MGIKSIIVLIYNLVNCTFKGIRVSAAVKKTIYIGRDTRIIGVQHFNIEKNVIIGKHNYLAVYGNGHFCIDEGANIGMYCQMAAINEIYIGKNVLFGPNVYIADYNHEYKDIDEPISRQGLKMFSKGVKIGDDSWIGKNVVIVGGCEIGKHCVIGANSFVNHDLPDYTVCVGNPCRPIKKYDVSSGDWISM